MNHFTLILKLKNHPILVSVLHICLICLLSFTGIAQNKTSDFKVIAFYTGREDQAHISFLHESLVPGNGFSQSLYL
jgi:hypothetical protein